jgi:MFS family permease
MYRQPPIVRAKRQIREGLSYVWRTPVLRSTLLLMVVVGTFSLNFQVVIPLMAKVTFGGTASTYGLISSIMGTGSLIGALGVASRHKPTNRMLLLACLSFGAMMILTSLSPSLEVALPLFFLTGMASIAFMATANSMLQLAATPSMRGRVMALYTMVFLGSTPIGGPIIGYISQQFGPRFGFGVGGLAALGGALVSGASLVRTRRLAGRGIGAALPVREGAPEPAAA